MFKSLPNVRIQNGILTEQVFRNKIKYSDTIFNF